MFYNLLAIRNIFNFIKTLKMKKSKILLLIMLGSSFLFGFNKIESKTPIGELVLNRSANCIIDALEILALTHSNKNEIENKLLPCFGIIQEGYSRSYNSNDKDYFYIKSKQVRIVTTSVTTYSAYLKSLKSLGFYSTGDEYKYDKKHILANGKTLLTEHYSMKTSSNISYGTTFYNITIIEEKQEFPPKPAGWN